MANIKTRYAEVTRSKKSEISRESSTASNHPRASEVERLASKFRSRAREDFRTLTPRR